MILEKRKYIDIPRPSPGELFYEERVELWNISNNVPAHDNCVLCLLRQQRYDELHNILSGKMVHYLATREEL